MTKKHLFSRLQIKVRPKGLHKSLPPDPWPLFPARFTAVERALQIKLFMQNKAKFRKSQMNVNKALTKDYEKKTLGERGKKQSQTNPNKPKSKKAKMNVTAALTKGYENISPIMAPKKQSQISKRQKLMQTSIPQRIMKKTAISGSYKTNPNKPKQTQSNPTCSELVEPISKGALTH